MSICKLCLTNEADKTGSHIVPHFLMKRIDSDARSRDKELGFVIDRLQSRGYFGRGVSEDRLKEVYGEVNEELIENNQIAGIVDYYFCRSCEDKLGKVESEYAKSISVFTDKNENYQSTKLEGIGFFFWSSILWRLSVQEGSGFKLSDKEEKRLRRVLHKYLPDLALNNKDLDLMDIGYIVLRSPDYNPEKPSYLHWEPNYRRPYSIMVGEYILFFYFKEAHMKDMILDFYGTHVLKSLAVFNTPFESEKVLCIGSEILEQVNKMLNLRLAGNRMLEYSSMLDELHNKLGARGKMDENVKKRILGKFKADDKPLGKRHTLESFREIVVKEMMDIYGGIL